MYIYIYIHNHIMYNRISLYYIPYKKNVLVGFAYFFMSYLGGSFLVTDPYAKSMQYLYMILYASKKGSIVTLVS